MFTHTYTHTYAHTHAHSIGGATGYRASELTGLSDGSTLVVGGKEVEVATCIYTVLFATATSSTQCSLKPRLRQ